MKRLLLDLLFILVLINLSLSIKAQPFLLDSTFVQVDVLTDSVDIPWEILWGADNYLWITDGPNIKRIDPISGVSSTIYNKPGYNGLGMVLHPNFLVTSEVFIVYDTTNYYNSGMLCELYKYSYSFSGDSLYNETFILSYPHSGEHSGGRLAIASDGKLMLTTADFWFNAPLSDSLKGKILRINLDGTIPSDNPSYFPTKESLKNILAANVYTSLVFCTVVL